MYQKIKKYRLIDQKIAIEKCYPEGDCEIKKGVLHWKGLLQPTSLSNRYHIKMEYRHNKSPKVILYGENIKKLKDANFPHHFHINYEKNEVELCLYYRYEFSSRNLIADTIIPWTVEWLYFYEIWLATGEWQGGGKHPK